MINMTNTFAVDEKTFQIRFYEAVLGPEFDKTVMIDRSTDG